MGDDDNMQVRIIATVIVVVVMFLVVIIIVAVLFYRRYGSLHCIYQSRNGEINLVFICKIFIFLTVQFSEVEQSV